MRKQWWRPKVWQTQRSWTADRKRSLKEMHRSVPSTVCGVFYRFSAAGNRYIGCICRPRGPNKGRGAINNARRDAQVRGTAHRKAGSNKKALKPEIVKAGKTGTCLLICMVPGAGIEPARCFHRQILSLLRLPISPPRQHLCIIADLLFKSNRHVCHRTFFVSKIVKCSTIGGLPKKGPTTPRH